MEKISYTGKEETDFIEEDPRSEVIKSLTDPDEIKASQELLEEKYNTPATETVLPKVEPEKKAEKATDTSTDGTDKTETTENEDAETKKPKTEEAKTEETEEKADDFFLTDDVIGKYSENSTILERYKGKSKGDIAKAAANAIAMKNEYMKGDETVIGVLAEKLSGLPEDKLIETLIDTQKEVGKQDYSDVDLNKEVKIDLPSLPENDPKIQAIVNEQVIKRMKKIYPDFPDSLSGDEYLDFEREIREEKGGLGERKLLAEISDAADSVNSDLKNYLYAQTSLSNLYEESPTEVYNFLQEFTLPQLKNINDNSAALNNKIIQSEVKLIEKELGNYGLTPEDIGVDLELKEVDGALYNKNLHDLLFKGGDLDNDVLRSLGKVALLKEGKLAQKFNNAFRNKILTAYVDKKTSGEKIEREKLKGENLQNINTRSQPTNPLNANSTNPDHFKKIMDEIENKY